MKNEIDRPRLRVFSDPILHPPRRKRKYEEALQKLETIQYLSIEDANGVLYSISANPHAESSSLQRVFDEVLNGYQRFLSMNGSLNPDDEEYVYLNYPEIMKRLVGNPLTPPRVLNKIFEMKSVNLPLIKLENIPRINRLLSSNPNTPVEVLRELDLSDEYIREHIIRRHDCPAEILFKIYDEDTSPRTRAVISEHKNFNFEQFVDDFVRV